jgi:hypothetical protein
MNNWILIDDSHPRFDRWQHCTGFVEAFWKGQNPNLMTAKETSFGLEPKAHLKKIQLKEVGGILV